MNQQNVLGKILCHRTYGAGEVTVQKGDRSGWYGAGVFSLGECPSWGNYRGRPRDAGMAGTVLPIR